MRLRVSADAWWESRVDAVLYWLASTSYWIRFEEEEDYGSGLDGVIIFLICREPEFNFKRRIRYSRKDKKIYMDIMPSLPEFINLAPDERKRKVVDALLKEVPEVVGKYKIEDFDTQRFLSDFNQKFTSILP